MWNHICDSKRKYLFHLPLSICVSCVAEISLFTKRESKNKTGKVACTKCLFSIEGKQYTEQHSSEQFRVLPPEQMLHPILMLSGPLIKTSQNFLNRWKNQLGYNKRDGDPSLYLQHLFIYISEFTTRYNLLWWSNSSCHLLCTQGVIYSGVTRAGFTGSSFDQYSNAQLRLQTNYIKV